MANFAIFIVNIFGIFIVIIRIKVMNIIGSISKYNKKPNIKKILKIWIKSFFYNIFFYI